MNLQSFAGQRGGENISTLLNKPDSACFDPKTKKPLSCFNSNPIKKFHKSISYCLLETQHCFIKFSNVFQYRTAEPCCRQLHDVLSCQCLLPLTILGCWFIKKLYSMLSSFASLLTIFRCFPRSSFVKPQTNVEEPRCWVSPAVRSISPTMCPAVRSISPTMCPAVCSLLYQSTDVDVAVGSSPPMYKFYITVKIFSTPMYPAVGSSLPRCTPLSVLLSLYVPRCRFFSPSMYPLSVLLSLYVPHCRCTPQAIMSYSIRHAVNANSEVTQSSKTGLFCLFFFLSRFYYCNRIRHGIPIVAFPIVPLTLHKNKREHAESLKIVHFYVKIFSDISGPDYLSVSSAL